MFHISSKHFKHNFSTWRKAMPRFTAVPLKPLSYQYRAFLGLEIRIIIMIIVLRNNNSK